MEVFAFNLTEIILLSIAGLLFIIQLCYIFGLYYGIHRHSVACEENDVDFTDNLPPISVIVRSCDQSENLKEHLPHILEQDYPNFEVIVVNDGSTDESEEVLKIFAQQYPNLYHSFTPNNSRYVSRKKLALSIGIKAAKNDWLVFIEPDCYPTSDQWLRMLARNFTKNTKIVLGYSNYDAGKGWFHKRTVYDMLIYSMRYLGAALSGKPYIGIGRNMAYRKELFFNSRGYADYLNLQRGEDDLFINQVATEDNTRVEVSEDSLVRIEPVSWPEEWKQEKVSYLHNSQFYKGFQHFWWGFDTTTRLLFVAVCLASVVVGLLHFHWLVLGISLLLLLLRYIFWVLILNKNAQDLNEGRFYFVPMIFDFLLPLQTLNLKFYQSLHKETHKHVE